MRFLKRRYYFVKDGIIAKTHEKYVPSLVKTYNLENRRGKGTPEGSMQQLDVGEPLSFEAKRKFRSALGTLLYLTQDRIDVQHGVRNFIVPARRVPNPRCTDTPIHRYPPHTDTPISLHTPIHRYTDIPTHRYTDIPPHRYTDIPTRTDTPIHRYPPTPIHRYPYTH